MAGSKTCKNTVVKGKRKGEVCGRVCYADSDRCWGHQSKEVKASKGFGMGQKGSGRPRKPRAIETLKARIEADIDSYLAPIAEALEATQAVVKRFGDGDGGFHEEVQFVVDHNTRLKAAGMALDRVYGRPRQAMEITGEDGGPIQTYDLSKLSTDQVLALRDAMKAAAVAPAES